VHLSHRGYPIVGDDLYGGKHVSERDLVPADDPGRDSLGDAPLLTRQCLHAAMLGFRHPMTETPMRFEAPLPGDFRRAVEVLRRGLRREVSAEGAELGTSGR
jgi:23S rRNA pseudouridine1911/1915/1917 synthase